MPCLRWKDLSALPDRILPVRFSPVGPLSGGMVGALLLIFVLVHPASAQAPDPTDKDRAPTLVAPAPGGTITHPDSLRFRWRVDGGLSTDETTSYRRLHERLVVTPAQDEQGSDVSPQEDRPRFVKTYPVPIEAPPRPAPSTTGPYPVVGDWFPEVEDQPTPPSNQSMRRVRLSHPTVGDWYPGDPARTPLPDGVYRWEIRLVAETAAGEEQLLASSQSSTFTVDLAEDGSEEESPPGNRTVQLDLFDLRLTGRHAKATLVRKPSSEEDHTPWRIKILNSGFPVTLHWNPASVTDSLPDATVRLVDAETEGNLIDVDLKGTSTLKITNPDVTALEVQSDRGVSTVPPDNVSLSLMPKLGAFLSGVSSIGDISGETGSALGGEQSVLSWGGSLAFGSRNGAVNFRLTGLRTTGSLVSTAEGIESAEFPIPKKLLLLTGDLVLRPIPRFLVQPYAIGGAGARRLSIRGLEGTASGFDTEPRWDPTVQVGVGVDLRVGDVTIGLEIVDYLTGFGGAGNGLQHDAFAFLALGIPLD